MRDTAALRKPSWFWQPHWKLDLSFVEISFIGYPW